MQTPGRHHFEGSKNWLRAIQQEVIDGIPEVEKTFLNKGMDTMRLCSQTYLHWTTRYELIHVSSTLFYNIPFIMTIITRGIYPRNVHHKKRLVPILRSGEKPKRPWITTVNLAGPARLYSTLPYLHISRSTI
eukprot:scaffold22653_cov119-Cylindrotheca_fusiformis.AAC.16